MESELFQDPPDTHFPEIWTRHLLSQLQPQRHDPGPERRQDRMAPFPHPPQTHCPHAGVFPGLRGGVGALAEVPTQDVFSAGQMDRGPGF